MRTSARGIAFLERHEGVRLTAYRCPAGVWTIGAGLTAASGVVRPAAGMTITATEARALLMRALERYEADVRRAMPGAGQAAFDAGVSFHFNTGAIGRAKWVAAWRAGDWAAVERLLTRHWITGGGTVLPGLERRRREEFALLRDGDYGDGQPPAAAAPPAVPGPAAEAKEESGMPRLRPIPAGGWKTYAAAAALAVIALLEGPAGLDVPGVTLEENWLVLLLNAAGLASLRHGVSGVFARWLRG